MYSNQNVNNFRKLNVIPRVITMKIAIVYTKKTMRNK